MKKILTIISSILISLCLFTSVYAENSQKIVDDFDLLTDEEETQLNELINDYISKTSYDIIIYTTSEVGDYFDKYDEDDAVTALIDDFYDHNGYGLGENNDGIVICIIYGEETIGFNTYTIATCGNCQDTYNDSALEDLYSAITPYLSEGDFNGAFTEFINGASTIYDNYDKYHSQPVVVDASYGYVEALVPAIFPALFVGLIASAISFFILRSQLKHTGVKHTAGTYMNDKHINICRSGDIYLYTTRRVERIRHDDHDDHHHSHSSGSSSHISSSGVSHGGGGSHRF